jgi:hypothetical protein
MPTLHPAYLLRQPRPSAGRGATSFQLKAALDGTTEGKLS